MNSIDFNQDDRAISPRVSRIVTAESAGVSHASATPLLTHLFGIVRQRKWEIIGCICGALLIGLVMTLLMTPKYTASAMIEIKREDQSFADVDNTQQRAAAGDQEYYETQYGLLQSASLAQRVASDLRLQNSEDFFRKMGGKAAAAWFENGRVVAAAPSQSDRLKIAGNLLQGAFKVTPKRLSRLVEIKFTSPDAALSKRVIDIWGADFVQVTLERRFEATAYARSFLEKRLQQLRARIDESERRQVDYAAQQGIVNLPGTPASAGQAATPERSLMVDDLASLNQELTQATADRIRAESRLGAGGGSVTEALNNSAISGLREKRAELAADYAKLMVQFEPGYPGAKALQNQISLIDQAIAREESRVGGTLRETYRAALEREQNLRRRVGQLQNGVLDLRRRSIQYNIYERDADTNRQLYDALLQRYKAIGVAGGVGANNISLVDPAELPTRPSSPNLFLNLLVALVIGAGIGGLLALAREQVDQGIRNPDDVETLLGAPLLGTVPRVVGNTPLDALADPKSGIAEAYLSLRTNLSFATDHGVPATLAVTSSKPAEGKTTTSFALAQSLARSGGRVLLVDADMRSPSVHGLLGMQNKSGLSNYLSGNPGIADLVSESGTSNLSVMMAGPMPPSAPELLAGARFDMLLKELGSLFEYVVFDVPPVMGLADAPLIASHVEGTVFVVESGQTHRRLAQVAIDRLMDANAALIGVILTKFDPKKAKNSYGYNYGYGYGQED